MTNESKPDNSLFIIKFDDNDGKLKSKSIPIYDLANALISIQRIFNKAYLINNGDLTEHARVIQEERDFISLQISSHEKSSDVYGFSSFITDPAVQELLKELAKESIIALSIYAAKDIVEKISNAREKRLEAKNKQSHNNELPQSKLPLSENDLFLSSIHNEVFGIVRTMRDAGIITRIQISLSNDTSVQPVVFDQDTKFYIQSLENEKTYGEYQEIEGQIKGLFPETNTINIRKKQTKKIIKVHLTRQDFERIKMSDISTLKVGGRSVYAFGKRIDENKFDEFEATKILHV